MTEVPEYHLMVDLETMGTGHDAAITHVGAVLFTMDGKVHDEYNRHVLLESSMKAGMAVDAGTVKWWMAQNPEAVKIFLEGQKGAHSLSHVVHSFDQWCTRSQPYMIWAHGATFDLPILNTAMRLFNKQPKWGFRDARDTRTLFWLAQPFNPWLEAPVPGDVKHDALSDARRQARAVCRAYNFLRTLERRSTL